jgi:pyridoxamine 5'-phosphate oxidase
MNNLESVWDYCQKKLEIRKGAWRSAVLATQGEEGPEARTVIIREYQWPCITFFSDSRTDKIEDLKRNAQVCVVVYDPKKRVQVRLKGRAEVFTSGEIVEKAIKELPERSGFDYRTRLAPGSRVKSEAAARKMGETMNLALIRIELSELDCLLLRTEGHSRAVFTGPEEGSWVVP